MQQSINLHTIFTFASEEAHRLGNIDIMPDHMLLGILRLGAGKAFELLMQNLYQVRLNCFGPANALFD